MSHAATTLRRARDAGPVWYPADDLPTVRRLWRGGLLLLADWDAERGQGFRLSPAGLRALAAPARLIDFEPPAVPPPADNEPRRAEVQAGLLLGEPGPVTRSLVVILLLAFVLGGWLALRAGIPTSDYLFVGRHSPLLDRTAIAASYLQRGEWWRLLTAWLPHIGLQHFALNAVGLWYIGATVEAMWGRWRTLVLIVLSAVGGNLGAVLANPNGGAGASGIVYGLLAAQAAFVLLERRYLTPLQRQEWRSDLVRMVALMALMGSGPGFSWGAHLGGALAGFVTAVLLHVDRRVRAWPVRGLALMLLPGVVAVGVVLLPRFVGVPLGVVFGGRG